MYSDLTQSGSLALIQEQWTVNDKWIKSLFQQDRWRNEFTGWKANFLWLTPFLLNRETSIWWVCIFNSVSVTASCSSAVEAVGLQKRIITGPAYLPSRDLWPWITCLSVVAAVCLRRAALVLPEELELAAHLQQQPPPLRWHHPATLNICQQTNKQTNRWRSDNLRPCAYFLSNSSNL